MDSLHVANQPLPERERLGVRIVDAEDLYATRDPKQHRVAAGVPERLTILASEVDRVDVFVLLGRIFGVADAAVRPNEEPLRVLFHPRMIGRALQREVERNLQTEV